MIQVQSSLLGQLSLRKVKNTTVNDTANTGPAKLCAFLSKYVIQPNSVSPMMGCMKYLPKAMTMPEIAKITNAMALLQWAERSNGVKRSISTPVGLPCNMIMPLRQ